MTIAEPQRLFETMVGTVRKARRPMPMIGLVNVLALADQAGDPPPVARSRPTRPGSALEIMVISTRMTTSSAMASA